jgi:predicted RNA binding protein YcfA (HicA-like mRNA interferase family)
MRSWERGRKAPDLSGAQKVILPDDTINSIIIAMSKIDKTTQRMRDNPSDWRIASLETVAERLGIQVRKTGGSHVFFLHENSELVVTVPAKCPIKPIYIGQFLAPIGDIGAEL